MQITPTKYGLWCLHVTIASLLSDSYCKYGRAKNEVYSFILIMIERFLVSKYGHGFFIDAHYQRVTSSAHTFWLVVSNHLKNVKVN